MGQDIRRFKYPRIIRPPSSLHIRSQITLLPYAHDSSLSMPYHYSVVPRFSPRACIYLFASFSRWTHHCTDLNSKRSAFQRHRIRNHFLLQLISRGALQIVCLVHLLTGNSISARRTHCANTPLQTTRSKGKVAPSILNPY